MRIIDADALEKKLNERYDYLLNENGPYDHFTDGYEEAVSTVEDFPTVDAEVVVRCKDCKHYLSADEFEGGKRYMCEVNHFSYINSDGDMRYCSYGERKGDKHEH